MLGALEQAKSAAQSATGVRTSAEEPLGDSIINPVEIEDTQGDRVHFAIAGAGIKRVTMEVNGNLMLSAVRLLRADESSGLVVTAKGHFHIKEGERASKLEELRALLARVGVSVLPCAEERAPQAAPGEAPEGEESTGASTVWRVQAEAMVKRVWAELGATSLGVPAAVEASRPYYCDDSKVGGAGAGGLAQEEEGAAGASPTEGEGEASPAAAGELEAPAALATAAVTMSEEADSEGAVSAAPADGARDGQGEAAKDVPVEAAAAVPEHAELTAGGLGTADKCEGAVERVVAQVAEGKGKGKGKARR